jgi:hypothetical protein
MLRAALGLRLIVGDHSLKVAIVLAGLADWALAALLIAVSGFLFGAGPESEHGGAAAAIAWGAMIIACITAPLAGLVLGDRGRPGVGILVAVVPVIVAALAIFLPFHPY